MVVLLGMPYVRCKDCSVRNIPSVCKVSPRRHLISASLLHFPILSPLLPSLHTMHLSNIVQHPSLSHPLSVGMLHESIVTVHILARS